MRSWQIICVSRDEEKVCPQYKDSWLNVEVFSKNTVADELFSAQLQDAFVVGERVDRPNVADFDLWGLWCIPHSTSYILILFHTLHYHTWECENDLVRRTILFLKPQFLVFTKKTKQDPGKFWYETMSLEKYQSLTTFLRCCALDVTTERACSCSPTISDQSRARISRQLHFRILPP